MPVDSIRVRSIHQIVRVTFKGKGNFKSTNKAYVAVPATGAFDTQRFGTASAQKRLDREIRRQYALHYLPSLRAQGSANLHDYGVLLSSFENHFGNCYEMAALAGAHALRMGMAGVWLGSITDPGDHAFCVITGGAAPRWDAVGHFRRDRSDAWVIDPWANVCCPLREYDEKFTAKMRKWTGEGKRIYIAPTLFSGGGWTVPSAVSYLTGFRVGPLAYEEFRRAF